MPFKSTYHEKKERKCKYCANLAKRNVTKGGRNKGFYRTCGSNVCLTEQYRDRAVNARKMFTREKRCDFCGKNFITKHPRQKWCNECTNNGKNRSLIQRYGISSIDFDSMVDGQGGTCALCSNPGIFVDHSHFTGKVRGILCPKCNLGISFLENDKNWLLNALKYVSIS